MQEFTTFDVRDGGARLILLPETALEGIRFLAHDSVIFSSEDEETEECLCCGAEILWDNDTTTDINAMLHWHHLHKPDCLHIKMRHLLAAYLWKQIQMRSWE